MQCKEAKVEHEPNNTQTNTFIGRKPIVPPLASLDGQLLLIHTAPSIRIYPVDDSDTPSMYVPLF